MTVSEKTHGFRRTSTTTGNIREAVLLTDKDKNAVPSISSPNDVFFGLHVEYRNIVLGDMLGKGNFGEVHEAMYKNMNIALKTLNFPPSSTSDEIDSIVLDFHRELNILQVTRHPNIVCFYGAVQQNKKYCLLTELCEGSVLDLLRLIDKNTYKLTWGLVLNLADECAKAMEYLHGRTPKIIHRDLKAENLLITSSFTCKLSDFGLSRILDTAEDQAATLCGTPRWVAPEVYRGEVYNSKIDIYSYGILLWELFCFTKPYQTIDVINLPYMIAYQGLRPPLKMHIPLQVQRLMADCWDARPEKRPTFKEILIRLAQIRSLINLDVVVNTKLSFERASVMMATKTQLTASNFYRPEMIRRASSVVAHSTGRRSPPKARKQDRASLGRGDDRVSTGRADDYGGFKSGKL